MKPSSMIGVVLCVALVSATELSHQGLRALDAQDTVDKKTVMPSITALRFLALSYKTLAADYYWLRALIEFGDWANHESNYSDLSPYLERTLALDPKFASAYFFAGTALTLKGMDSQLSNRLLHQGVIERPDDWRIPFYLGFNYYYFEQDMVQAAEYLNIAAENPEAPPIVLKLAIRFAAHSGRAAMGLSMLNTVIPTISDSSLRSEYIERRNGLLLEIEIQDLQEISDRYFKETGSYAQNFQELIDAGVIQNIEDDPLGGTYAIDSAGRVTTTSERLRVYQEQR